MSLSQSQRCQNSTVLESSNNCFFGWHDCWNYREPPRLSLSSLSWLLQTTSSAYEKTQPRQTMVTCSSLYSAARQRAIPQRLQTTFQSIGLVLTVTSRAQQRRLLWWLGAFEYKGTSQEGKYQFSFEAGEASIRIRPYCWERAETCTRQIKKRGRPRSLWRRRWRLQSQDFFSWLRGSQACEASSLSKRNDYR